MVYVVRQVVADVASDPAAIWKFVAFTLGGVVVIITLALVKLASMLLQSKVDRIKDNEALIAKLEAAREARTRREITDRRDA